MAMDWDKAVAAATKILGDKAKIPKLGSAIPKAVAAEDKAFDAFDKVRQDLKAKVLGEQNALQALKDAIVQFQDEIDEDDLGLDPKNKDDAKKIDSARKILSGALQEKIDQKNDNIKDFRELDKHLMNIVNYKPGA
jgi:mannose-6-phosphate isomerase class I